MFGLFDIFSRSKTSQDDIILQQINDLEGEIGVLKNEEIREKSLNLKTRAIAGESLSDLLPEAFALARESAKRTLGQRHFDTQMLGGVNLHKGMIVEMMTGEGKTLAVTAPAYLNALSGQGVHIITVNDYLATRDAVWMGQIYYFLGVSTACITHNGAFIYDPDFNTSPSITNEEKKADETRDKVGSFLVEHKFLRPITRRQAYLADITYGTNHEFGFDYLRDNLAAQKDIILNQECVSNIEERIVRGDSLAGLIENGQTVRVLFGYYDCNEIKRDDIVLYSLSGRENPLIKIVKGIPGEKLSLKQVDGGALPAGIAGQTLRHTGTAWVADSNLFNTGTNVGIGTTAPTSPLHVMNLSVFADNTTASAAGLTSGAFFQTTSGVIMVMPMRSLSVSSTGINDIIITSATGHGGTTNYTLNFNTNTVVALTAPSRVDRGDFINWIGCDSVTGTTCNLTVTTHRTVTVNYQMWCTRKTSGTAVGGHAINRCQSEFGPSWTIADCRADIICPGGGTISCAGGQAWCAGATLADCSNWLNTTGTAEGTNTAHGGCGISHSILNCATFLPVLCIRRN